MNYNFVRFENPKSDARPEKMQVGQIVERRPCMNYYRAQLKTAMRKMIREKGMAFSIHEDEEKFVIRRDK
jgi:hypothetical protein